MEIKAALINIFLVFINEYYEIKPYIFDHIKELKKRGFIRG